MTYGEIWWQLLLLCLGAYLIGNINWATFISHLKKKDVRQMGSGNPGTMNMLRNFGAGLGALTLVLDILKGVVPCLIGLLVYRGKLLPGNLDAGELALFCAGFFVVLGHIYPFAMKFKGGKGVATTFGVFFVAEPVWMAAALVFTILFIVIFQYGGLADLIVIGGLTIVQAVEYNAAFGVSGGFVALMLLLAGICFLTFFAHRKNIADMLSGREHKTNLRRIIAKIFKRKKKNESVS